MELAQYLILGVIVFRCVTGNDLHDISRRLDRQEDKVSRLTQDVSYLEQELRHEKKKSGSLASRVSHLEQVLATRTPVTPEPIPGSEDPKGNLIHEKVREILRHRLDNFRLSFSAEKRKTSQVSAAVQLLKDTSRIRNERLDVVRQRLEALGKKTEDLAKNCDTCMSQKYGRQLNDSIGQVKQTLAEQVIKVAKITELQSVKEVENCTKDEVAGPVRVPPVVLTTSPAPSEEDMKACPDNWVPYGGSCYYFQQTKVNVDHHSASESCNTMYAGSVLVAIETADEFKFLKNHLTSLYYSIRPRPFSGWMTSGKKDGDVYKWTSTGKAVNISALSWKTGEPDGNECLTFWPRSFNMTAVMCGSYRRQYICEI